MSTDKSFSHAKWTMAHIVARPELARLSKQKLACYCGECQRHNLKPLFPLTESSRRVGMCFPIVFFFCPIEPTFS